jgi:hypothetical protein
MQTHILIVATGVLALSISSLSADPADCGYKRTTM